MKKSTTIVLVAAAFALSFASIAIMIPKAVKAAVATLIRDQDQAARRPFTTTCSSSSGTPITACATPRIPAGEEVVIETVSFFGSADPTNTRLQPQLETTASGVFQSYVFNFIEFSGAGEGFGSTQPVRLYADPDTPIGCLAFTQGANPLFGLSLTCVISGYSVSLP